MKIIKVDEELEEQKPQTLTKGIQLIVKNNQLTIDCKKYKDLYEE